MVSNLVSYSQCAALCERPHREHTRIAADSVSPCFQRLLARCYKVLNLRISPRLATATLVNKACQRSNSALFVELPGILLDCARRAHLGILAGSLPRIFWRFMIVLLARMPALNVSLYVSHRGCNTKLRTVDGLRLLGGIALLDGVLFERLCVRHLAVSRKSSAIE